MTTMPIDNNPLTQRRLQFIGIGVNKRTLKSNDIIQSSNNYNIVSSFICWNQKHSTTPYVICVTTGVKLAPQSPDTRVHVQNIPNTPGRKLPHQPQTQPHIVKVGDLAFKPPVASGSSALAGFHIESWEKKTK